MIGIYCIENIHNNKKYIGFSVDVTDRLKKHFYNLKKNIHKNPHLQSSYNKNEKDSFITYLLQECSQEDLIKNEKKWISLLNSKNRVNGYNKIEPGIIRNNFTQSEETIKLKREKTQKKVNQYSLFGIFIKEHNSIKDAAEEIGIHSSGITNCCKRKFRQKTAGGFLWRYIGDVDLTFTKTCIQREVYQYDLDNNLINKFKSINEASRITKIHVLIISNCLNNKRSNINNFIFKSN